MPRHSIYFPAKENEKFKQIADKFYEGNLSVMIQIACHMLNRVIEIDGVPIFEIRGENKSLKIPKGGGVDLGFKSIPVEYEKEKK